MDELTTFKPSKRQSTVCWSSQHKNNKALNLIWLLEIVHALLCIYEPANLHGALNGSQLPLRWKLSGKLWHTVHLFGTPQPYGLLKLQVSEPNALAKESL